MPLEAGEQCPTCGNDFDPMHPCRCGADTFPCSACGKPTHIDLLDAKDDGTGNYVIFECEPCYGPGWVHGKA